MPASALVGAGLEHILNQALQLDQDSQQRLQPLAGKQLHLCIDELPVGLTLAFSTRIDVLTFEQSFEAMATTLGADACALRFSLSQLKALQDTTQLTRLIREGQLDLAGDLSVAQGVATLFSELNPDFAEKLAGYLGDVGAHTVVSGVKAIHGAAVQHLTRVGSALKDALVEEKQLVAPAIAVKHFADEVGRLRNDTERLEARIKVLEASRSSASKE